MSADQPVEAVKFTAADQSPEAGPGGTPKVLMSIRVEVSGEWVEPDMIAYAARQLAASMAGKLREAADQAGKEGPFTEAQLAAFAHFEELKGADEPDEPEADERAGL